MGDEEGLGHQELTAASSVPTIAPLTWRGRGGEGRGGRLGRKGIKEGRPLIVGGVLMQFFLKLLCSPPVLVECSPASSLTGHCPSCVGE